MNDWRNRYYFNVGNVFIALLVFALILFGGLYLIGLAAGELALPGTIVWILKAILFVYVIFGVFGLFSRPENV